jgi:hypothetical protein
MNILFGLLLTILSILPGMQYTEVEKEMGRTPDFKYEKVVHDLATKGMKFGVYGWDEKQIWYCVQTTNDTVLNFYTFKSKKEYNKFITINK